MQNIMAQRSSGWKIPKMHLHRIWYVEADKTYHVIRQKKVARKKYTVLRTLSGGGMLHMNSGIVRTFCPDSIGIFYLDQVSEYYACPQGWRFYWFEFEAPEGICLPEFFSTIHLSALENAQLEQCFEALSSGTENQCRLADALFNYLLVQWQIQAQDAEPDLSILSLLERGRRQRLTVPQMAQAAAMSERSFRSAVHRATGLSPTEYMLKGEMAAAMDLLRTTEMSVSQIAACFQYSSPLYFSRVFKKYYGVSPQHARQQLEL